MKLTRRSLLLGAAFGLAGATEALAARKKKKKAPAPSASRKSAPPAKKGATDEAAAKQPSTPKRPEGRSLAIPELVELKDGATYELTAGPVTHSFLEDKPVQMAGYGGRYLGPVLKVTRGTTPTVRLVNRLDRRTNIHWHGLLVDGIADGGSHVGVGPGQSWEAKLPIDQPAATLWYHAHVHGRVAEDLQEGLAGMLIVEDDASRALALPSTWGVDDLPLILQDRDFDADGRPVYERTPDVADHGFRGTRMVVNGTLDAVASVPQRLVRLRILNASSARSYRLYFVDERPFTLIATDGGLLPEPREADTLSLAPGERVEMLVDFADGGTALMSTPDEHEHRVGADITRIPDRIAAPVRLVAFFATRDDKPSHKVPATLVPESFPATAPAGALRRRFVLQLGLPLSPAGTPVMSDHAAHMHAAAAEGPVMRINGKTFDPTRIDEKVAFGATEIWEIVSPEMAHPFHIHGAQFRMLTEDGGTPKIWNRGVKDTVLVENSAELLVTFNRRAGPGAPFVYHCHVLEHEDAGMMGTFTVL